MPSDWSQKVTSFIGDRTGARDGASMMPEARSRVFEPYGREVAESTLHRPGSEEQRKPRAALVERALCQPSQAERAGD
jgi:hypothetical protein